MSSLKIEEGSTLKPTQPQTNAFEASSVYLAAAPDDLSYPPARVAERYPFCVVWTPIPLLTWFLPFLGHVGITDSSGHIFDFQGTRCVGRECMLFGQPTKVWCIRDRVAASSSRDVAASYDTILLRVTQHFCASESYSFLSNNCHAYVNAVLREIDGVDSSPGGHESCCHPCPPYNTLTLALRLVLHARFVSCRAFLSTYLAFFILVATILLFQLLWLLFLR